jgi:tetratricopeptide (TPR) repeat protein
MIKSKLVYLGVLLFICSFLYPASIDYAQQSINKAKIKYSELRPLYDRGGDISSSLDKASSLIMKASKSFTAGKYNKAVSNANSAIAELNKISLVMKNSGRGITKSKVQSRIFFAQNVFAKMKKYDFRSDAILNAFTEAKTKIKFAQLTLNEGKTVKSNKLVIDAIKILFTIPNLYTNEWNRKQRATIRVFGARVMSQYTARYHVKHPQTKSEFRRVLFYLNKAMERLDAGDYNGVNVATKKVYKVIKETNALHRKLVRQESLHKRRCREASEAIQFAQATRRKSQLNIRNFVPEEFSRAKIRLSGAEADYRAGRCENALKNALLSAKLFYTSMLFGVSAKKYKGACEKYLRDAKVYLEKTKRTRLPLDAQDQVDQAQSDINRAKILMKQGDFEKAYRVLEGTVVLLKSLLR